VTSPLVIPARRVLPSVAGLDTPTLVVLIVLEGLATWLLLWLLGVSLPVQELLFYSLLRLVALTLWFYTVALFVYVILSWFGDRGMNPLGVLLSQLVEPVLRPARRLLPPIGGFDLSPLIVLLLLQAAMIALPLPPFLR
jgi:YggT family protein